MGRPVFVATNLLESMVTSPVPTLAEINDIYNTLADGADGLVLAAEIAVGKFPAGCVVMVMKVIAEFERIDSLSYECIANRHTHTRTKAKMLKVRDRLIRSEGWRVALKTRSTSAIWMFRQRPF